MFNMAQRFLQIIFFHYSFKMRNTTGPCSISCSKKYFFWYFLIVVEHLTCLILRTALGSCLVDSLFRNPSILSFVWTYATCIIQWLHVRTYCYTRMLCHIIMLFNIHNRCPYLSVTSTPICYRYRLLSPFHLHYYYTQSSILYKWRGWNNYFWDSWDPATYYFWSMSSSMTTSPAIARDYCHQDFPNKVNSPAIFFNIFMFLHKLYAYVPQINIYTVSNYCLHYWSCARYRKSKLE